MPLPIKLLPLAERWDCGRCGRCCRGSRITLDEDDLQRLREQHWDRQAEYRRVATVIRTGWFSRQWQLAQRDDGTCIFLQDGICRIHQEFGYESKPLVCRMYPLQLVPLDNLAYLTLRRSCPAAAADQGRDVAEHRSEVTQLVRRRPRLAESGLPPSLVRGCHRSWKDVLVVAGALRSLLTDQRFPLVRRLVHGLRFCELLESCRLARLETERLRELVSLLTDTALQDASGLFRDRRPPGAAAGALFRQTVMEYLRLHPGYSVRESWGERWRLSRAAWAFARGQGGVPRLHASFPETTFEAIEARVFSLAELTLQQPLMAYFETHAVSLQYAVLSRPGWSLVEKFRALALTYPVALWMLRYFAGERPPTAAATIDVVTALERGQGYGPLAGQQHRRRLAQCVGLQALEQLIPWYAR